MTIVLKAIYKFSAIPIKVSMTFSQNYNKSKVCMETQKTLIKLSNLEEENKAEGIILTDFKLHYKTRLIKTV